MNVSKCDEYYEKKLKKILNSISKEYKIDKKKLFNKYLYCNFNNNFCLAKKQDGYQCTRRKKKGFDFCGKHINSRKNGRIDVNNEKINDNSYILTEIEKFGNKEYLIDENNILFSKNINEPEIIGKKINGKITFLDQIAL